MIQAEQAARKRKLDIIGFYHSHPDHPAFPSDYDKEHALPFYSYVIISVNKNGDGKRPLAEELTSWELTADRKLFESEKIIKGEAK